MMKAIDAGNADQNRRELVKSGYPIAHVNLMTHEQVKAALEREGLKPATTGLVGVLATTWAAGKMNWIRRNVASTVVIAYALVVIGSLFCVPWMLTFRPYKYFGAERHPEPIVRWPCHDAASHV